MQVFREENEQIDDPDGNLKVPTIKDQNGCIYIPDVVLNPDMHYYRIPRLGAYYAVPIMVKSYLNDLSLDDAIVKIKAYSENVAQNQAEKEAKRTEITEKMDNTAGPHDDEYQRLAEELEEFERNWEDVPEPVFEADVKMYVLCCDTLGKDKEISLADREFIFDFCSHFKNSWETKELNLIKAQADALIKYEIDELPDEKNTILEEALERDHRAYIDSGFEPDEALAGLDIRYKENEAKRIVLLDQLGNLPAKRVLFELPDFEHIKFSSIVQLAFLLSGYKKEDINIPETDTLDWRKMKHEFNEDLIKKLESYQYKGSKAEEVPAYAKIPVLRKKISRFGKPF